MDYRHSLGINEQYCKMTDLGKEILCLLKKKRADCRQTTDESELTFCRGYSCVGLCSLNLSLFRSFAAMQKECATSNDLDSLRISLGGEGGGGRGWGASNRTIQYAL